MSLICMSSRGRLPKPNDVQEVARPLPQGEEITRRRELGNRVQRTRHRTPLRTFSWRLPEPWAREFLEQRLVTSYRSGGSTLAKKDRLFQVAYERFDRTAGYLKENYSSRSA